LFVVIATIKDKQNYSPGQAFVSGNSMAVVKISLLNITWKVSWIYVAINTLSNFY